MFYFYRFRLCTCGMNCFWISLTIQSDETASLASWVTVSDIVCVKILIETITVVRVCLIQGVHVQTDRQPDRSVKSIKSNI